MHWCYSAGYYDSYMHSCYSARVIVCLFLTLGWSAISHLKNVAGCTFQCVSLMWDCSLWCIWPPLLLLPYYGLPCLLFWSFPQMLCGQCCFGVHISVMVLSGVPYTFPQKVLADSPIYSFSQSILLHLNQYITFLFFLMLSLSLGDTSKFLMVFPSLKYTCIPYFLQMFLKLSLIPWEYGTTIWHIFLCNDWCCFFLLVLSCWCFCLWRIFFIVHLGYLQPLRTSSTCFNSLLMNSGVEHKVLALCVRVLITLYLEAKLWSLSHWRYWSVWVGFLYTFVVKVPSTLGVRSLRSKMGWNHLVQLLPWWTWWTCPLGWYVGRISSLCDSCWITKVSSTYLFHILGGACSTDGSVLKSLHIYICHNWAHWWSHGSTFGLFKALTIEKELGVD